MNIHVLTTSARDELRGIAPLLAGTLATSGIVAVLGLASGVIAARSLGPDGRGDLAQLVLWPQVFTTVGNLGIDLASTYLSADARRSDRVPAALLPIALVQSIFLVALYVALAPLLFRGAGVTREAIYMAPLIPSYLLGAYAVAALGGRQRFSAYNAVRFTMPLLYSAGLGALLACDALSPMAAALTFMGAHAAADALAVALLFRLGATRRVDKQLARDAWAYGLRAHFGRLSPQAIGLDMVIIAIFLSSKDLGLFAAAMAFMAVPRLVTVSTGMVIFPRISASHLAGERAQYAATFALYAAGSVALAAALWLLAAPLIITVFGAEFRDAALILRLLALATAAMALRAFPLEVLRGIGRPGITSLAEAANWVLFFIAVPAGAATAGLAGTAAGIAIASCGSLAVLGVLAWRSGAFALPAPHPRAVEALEAA